MTLVVIAGLAAYVLLPQLATFERSFVVLRGMALWIVCLAVAAQCLCYVCHGYVIRALLGLFGVRVTFMRSIALVMASYSLSLVWGGQLTNTGATFRWLRAAGVPAEAALLTGVAPALLNLLSFTAAAVFGLGYLLVVQKLSLVAAALVASVLLLLVLNTILVWRAMRRRSWLESAYEHIGTIWSRLRRRPHDSEAARTAAGRLFDAWELLLAGRWRAAVSGDALSMACDFLTLYLLFWASGHAPGVGLVLAGYGLPLLAGKLSVLPGGIGIIEGGLVAAYEVLGVPSAIVVVVVLGYRLISFWLPVLIGFGFALWLDRQTQQPRAAPDPL